jgi:hypothetical protein
VVGPAPTAAFAGVTLDVAEIAAGELYGRIHRRAYPDPLGCGKNASRFSDPRRSAPDRRFGVLYLGSSLKVCFVEAVLRDQRDGVVGDLEIAEADLDDRLYSEVRTTSPLQLVDLREDGPLRMGIPSDVVRGRTQSLARKWSLAIFDHPAHIDGIIYPSRLNGEANLAIYDRSVPKLRAASTADLVDAPGLGDLLNEFLVALI